MSSRYSTISGLLGFVEHSGNTAASQMEIEILPDQDPPASPTRRTRKRDSLRKISVRHLVSKIETRAAETLERNFGGRFSGRLRREKRDDESTEPGTAAAASDLPSSSSAARTWYMIPLSSEKLAPNQSALSLCSSVATDDNSDSDDVQRRRAIGRDKISADSTPFSER
uniref:Uncharacterized protein n=1 Tax=Anopheles epiroticus TaxID=199890 RepID=A0A182P032_9DIPT